jgi:hypothetical protein
MSNYEIIENTDHKGATEKLLKKENEDGSVSFIPMDEANSDYQRYLNPEAEHFTPIVINEAETI